MTHAHGSSTAPPRPPSQQPGPEEKQERVLFLLVVTSMVAWAVMVLAAGESASGLIEPSLPFLIISLFASIPAAMVQGMFLILATGRVPRFNVHHPHSETTFESPLSLDDAAAKVCERAGKLGFSSTVVVENDARVVMLQRQVVNATTFLGHGFTGWARVRQGERGVVVSAHVVFLDTVLLDSGEQVQLDGLAQYFALQAHRAEVATLSFVTHCGSALAVIATIAALGPLAGFALAPVAGGASLAAIMMLVTDLLMTREMSREVLPRRVTYAALVLAVMPWAVHLLA